MKTIKMSSLIFVLSISFITGCDGLFVRNSKFDCNYSFLKCENGKIENSYKDHKARVQRVTESNQLPAPYDKEIFLINMDPDNLKDIKELSTGQKYVIPCGDLPKEFQKDNLVITVSGEQLSCYKVLATSPDLKVVGNAVFNVKSIKSL